MKFIETDEEYNLALKRADELIDIDPHRGTHLGVELQFLTVDINRYENHKMIKGEIKCDH